MAAKTSAKAKPPAETARPPLPEPTYPTLEQFVERASGDDIQAVFSGIESALADLKGPRAQQGKKVAVAIERTRELLSHLVEVREKLEAEKRSGGKARK